VAGRAEGLVIAIRAQRRRVHEATDEVLMNSEIPRRIRRSPVPWLLGAGLAGVVAGRWVVPPLLRSGRRQFQGPMRVALQERLRSTLTAAVAAAVGRFAARGNGDGTAEPDASPSRPANASPDSSDPALSIQPPNS
jgi:hypothetical protein